MRKRGPAPWRLTYYADLRQASTPRGLVPHLAISRYDGKPIRCEWSTLQKIKDDLLGSDVVAIEVYPPASDVVDETNARHLWVVPPDAIPVNLKRRGVTALGCEAIG